jgi:hypothetical protein
MKFFVPDAEPEKYEDLYASYAAMCRTGPVPDGERIRSISWSPTPAETWTAEVGRQLSVKVDKVKGRGADRREYVERRNNAAKVLAIFPGVPYMVVTNKGFDPKVRTEWDNPFLASDKVTVVYFETAHDADNLSIP